MKTIVLYIILALTVGCVGLRARRTPDIPPQEPAPARTPAQTTFEYGMTGVGVTAVLLLGLSIFALVSGMAKIALAGVATSLAIGGGSVMMLYYGQELAWVLCVVACLAIIALAVWVYRTRRRIYGQLVETCEIAKGGMLSNKRIELFGGAEGDGLAGMMQSSDVRKIVKKERAKHKIEPKVTYITN